MPQELLHEMQEKLPLFVLLAAALLDLSGASRSGRAGSGALAPSFAAAAQPGAQSSPKPVTEGHWPEGPFHSPSPGADPTSGTAPEPTSHTGRAAHRTALLPRSLAGAELLHTAAPKAQHGHPSPGKLWSSSTQGSRAPTALQREPEGTPGAALSPPSSSSFQPFPSAGTHQDSPQVTALSSPPVIKQREVPSPKTSLLTPTFDFHPPRREMAASAFPPRAGISLARAGEGWLPTGGRPMATSPPAQPDPTAGGTPARPRRTQSADAGTAAGPPQPAPGHLGSVYSRPAQAWPAQLSSLLPLQQETTGSKGRNSSSAVTNGSGHPAQLPAPHTLPAGTTNSSSSWMEAPAPEGSLPSPFQAGTSDGQQPLSVHGALNCTQHLPPESSSSSQEMALQGDAAPWAETGRPGKPPSPESPQPPLSSSSVIQLWISTLKPSPTTKELKEATSALSPGMPTFGNGDLQPWDSVPARFQPPAASAPARAGMQPVGLHTPSTPSSPPGSGSQLQGASAPPVPQGALAGMLQVNTGRRSKPGSPALTPVANPIPKIYSPQLTPTTSPVPKTDSPALTSAASPLPRPGSPALSPAASPVPSPSGAHSHRDQAVPFPSLVPASPTKLAAPAPVPLSSHAQGSHPSSPTAQPGPGMPREVPAALAQALVHQFRTSQLPDAAAKNLSTARGDPLTLLPSSPHLSFVLKSTEGMICLQPMQDSPLPPEFPNSSLGGLLSIQQILTAPNSSALDLANPHLSPSSLVLVRPVFVLLPSGTAQVLPSPLGDHRMSHLATSVGTTGSSQGVPVKTSPSYPTGRSVGPGTALSTVSKQQAERAKVTSEPVPANPVPTALRGLSPAVTSAPGHVLEPRVSPTLQTMPRLPEEMQIPAPHPQQATDTALLSLAAEPGTSPVPPEPVSTQSLQSSPQVHFTTERPQSSPGALFPAAKGPRGSPEPAQPGSSTGAAGQEGSVPTPSPAHAPCTACLPSKPPPWALPGTKALQSPPQRLPGTELLPSPAAPSTSSASFVLPAGKEHSGSTAGSTARSAVPVPASAAPSPITTGKPGVPQRLELELSPAVPQPFTGTQRPRGQALLSTELQRRTTISGRVLPVVTPAAMSARSPAPAPAPAGLSSPPSTGQSTSPAAGSSSAEAGAGGSLGSSASPSAVPGPRTPEPPPAALAHELALTAARPAVSTGSVPALGGHPTASQAAAAGTALPAAKGDGGTAPLKGAELLHLPTPAGQPGPEVVLDPSGELPAALGGAARGDAAPTRQLPTLAPMPAAQPASPRLPLEVSHPLEKVSHPLEEMFHPLENISYPLENISHPQEEMFHPLEKVSHPLEEMFHPLENISHPLEEMFHPLENISHPLEEMFHPLENISHPLEEMFHPLENISHPLEEMFHPLENISHPQEMFHPLENISHPLEDIPHPQEEVFHPLENISHPLEEMFHALENISHPLEEMFHALEVSNILDKVSYPLEKVSPPLEEMFHPLEMFHSQEKVSYPLEKVSHPLEMSYLLENVSHPLEEMFHSQENVSHPLEKVSHPLEMSYLLENVSHPLEEMFHSQQNISHPQEEMSHLLEMFHSQENVSHPLEELFHTLEVSRPQENVSHPLENASHPLDKVSPARQKVSPPLEQGAMELDAGHSSPGTAARPPTPTAVPADGLVDAGTDEPAAHGRFLPQVSPAPGSPRSSAGSRAARTAPGQPRLGAAGTAPAPGLLPSTEQAEEEGRTREVTDGAAEGLGTLVTLEPGALRSDSQQRRGLHSDVTVLDGLATVSDSCGSGNHSVRLSLSPAGDTAPGLPGSERPQDTLVALVALQSNSSPALLQVHSCCVTPSASPGAAGAQCCLFRRLPLECRHIQLLEGGSSRATSFSIQLFQMLNHSVAYLHCELRVCLPGQPGCEQGCLESVEPLPQPSDRTSHGNLHKLVSLGPVWRMNNRFLYKPVQGAAPATLLPILLGSLTGCAVLASAFMGLWLHQRHRAKPSRYPPLGEFHGL